MIFIFIQILPRSLQQTHNFFIIFTPLLNPLFSHLINTVLVEANRKQRVNRLVLQPRIINRPKQTNQLNIIRNTYLPINQILQIELSQMFRMNNQLQNYNAQRVHIVFKQILLNLIVLILIPLLFHLLNLLQLIRNPLRNVVLFSNIRVIALIAAVLERDLLNQKLPGDEDILRLIVDLRNFLLYLLYLLHLLWFFLLRA